MEGIQHKFTALCQNFFYGHHTAHEDFFKLKIHTLYDRRFSLDALFFIYAYSGIIFSGRFSISLLYELFFVIS